MKGKLNNGASGTIRTCDLLIRSQMLYPTELRLQKKGNLSGILNNKYGGDAEIRTLGTREGSDP
jgi:hypothetical protein